MSEKNVNCLDPDVLRRNIPSQESLSGICIENVEKGEVSFSIDIPDDVINYHDKIHGGFLSTLAEIAAGMATYSHGVSNVALSASINFLSAAGKGKVFVQASTIHIGRSTAVIRSLVNHENGRQLVESTYTMFILGPA